MIDTQQKTKQIKNVAVALVKDEDGRILLVKPTSELESVSPKISTLKKEESDNWVLPANTIIPGASYSETFAAGLLEDTGCIVEAVSLVSSEKHNASFTHYEFVECKIICRDKPARGRASSYKWVHPSRLKKYFRKKLNRDLVEFFAM